MKSLLQDGRGSAGGEADPPDEEAQPPAEDYEPAVQSREPVRAAGPLKALPDFLPVKLPPFPWWALPLPAQAALPWSDPQAGIPHFPILDNLFLLLKIAESCFNCTFFLSVDTPLLLGGGIAGLTGDEGGGSSGPLDLSPANLRLLYYQMYWIMM
ncbi:hypothetical protein GOP47_0017555 [Adiantum capillus-veneris]|uniref:Uncharacterized protein n=1 Tax=Adiantum capillus-veneris TaxID=13818 RepID=A0A9D4ZAP7_ADICA|nr:hypothetical protein GOP47_0017555 [Adiantum capillus-veneris]